MKMHVRTGVFLAATMWLGVASADVEHREQYQKNFVARPGTRLIVEGINGAVRVTTHSGRDVRVNVTENWRADTATELADARSRVRLQVIEEPGTIKISVETPSDGHRLRGVHFSHSFDVAAPADLLMRLKTVNGDVHASGLRGEFELRTVNGKVNLVDAEAGGTAHTVNGSVDLSFARNPTTAVGLKTVNGSMTARFQPGLSADFTVKALNGRASTDFEYSPVAWEGSDHGQQSGMKKIYSARGPSAGRIGGGGIKLSFETVNGSIEILKRER